VSIDQSILSHELVNRYIGFVRGDEYNSEKLIELQQALSNHYFSRVHVRPLPEQAESGLVPIQVDLTPLRQHSFSLGLGVATDTGPRLKFDYANRYVNPDGHRFNTGLGVSSVRSEVLAGYSIPLQEPRHESLRFFTGHVEEKTDVSSSAITSLGTHYSFLNDGEWLQTWSLNFQRENFTVSDARDRTNLLIPGLSFAKVRSNDSVYPLQGWRLNASAQGASADILSDISFMQFLGDAKYVHALGRGRLLWHIRGGTTDVSDFDALPASLRFFAGGDTSVRGYEYRSLGPVDAAGNVIGGRRLLLAGLEYDRRFLPKWAIAAFYDAGNAFNDRDNYELKRGAGLGIRWLSPIGPIRLDIAKALDDSEEWRVHINMGPDL
jgi:translocation and assembly module TamA